MDQLADDINRSTKVSFSDTLDTKATPNNWKKESNQIFGELQTRHVWQNLNEAGLLPSLTDDLTFISPTANYPTHEITLYKDEVAKRHGKTIFLVGDISDIDPNPMIKDAQLVQDINHRFQYFKWDANKLPLSQENTTANVIWDRKGWLYYIGQAWIMGSVEERKQLLLNTLNQYHDLLAPKGVVVIDAINEKQLQFESSTTSVLTANFGQEIWDEISDKFLWQDLGEGAERIRVLVKKDKSESEKVLQSE